MATLAGVVAGGALLALPSGASASTVDCWGGAGAAPDSKGLAYSYSFQCHSLEGDPTQVDAYSIISNRPVAEFGTEVVVSKDGVALNDQSFGCEGTFPSEGFGCFGKASLDNTIQGGFKLQRNPCTRRAAARAAGTSGSLPRRTRSTRSPARRRRRRPSRSGFGFPGARPRAASRPQAPPLRQPSIRRTNMKGSEMLRNRWRAVAATAAISITAAVAPATAGATTITLSGSTSVAPLAAKLASKYVKSKKGVQFKLLQGGSDVGIADVSRGRVTLGMSSRDPKSSDPGGLVFNKIARDAICVVTNPDNKLSNISQAQVQAVFGGSVRDWGAVNGSSLNSTIDVIVRTAASGTQDAFQKIFLESTKVFSGASQKASNGLVQQAVSSNTSAIGYVSLAFTKGTNPVPYNGVPCTLQNAKSGQYSGVRSFYLVSRGAPTKAAQKWINWIRKNSKAQKIIASEWVPLS